MHTAGDNFRHVAVLVCNSESSRASSPFLIDRFLYIPERLFALFKFFCIMIPDDIAEYCMAHVALHVNEMIESLISVCIPGRFALRQHRVDLHGNKRSIYHNIFGRARMNIHAADPEFSFGGVEVLILDLTLRIAVQCVGKVSAEFFHIKMSGAHADLFVRSKGDGNGTVGDIFVQNPFCHGYDFSDTCLIVSSQDRCSIACDQGAPFQVFQMRKHIRRQDAAACAKGKFPAVVVFMNHRDDPPVAEVGYCVQMSDESQLRPVFVTRRGGNVRVQAAPGVYFHVCDPHSKKFPVQMVGKFELAGGRGYGIAFLVAGSSDCSVF